jgi:beta-mannosidase
MGSFSMRDGFGETVNVRKAASSFGWDIMPRLVSAGLWRNVELHIYNPIRFTDVFWITDSVDLKKKRSHGAVDIQIRAPFEAYEDLKAVINVSRNGKTAYNYEIAMTNMNQRVYFYLDNVDFWWPNGYGEAALYDAKVSLQNSKGEVFAVDKRKIGIRTVILDRSEDNTDKDGRFCFIVNGEKIFVRGTNWVPLSVLHSQDASFVKSTVDMVKDMNCNMIRCWGGNVYEDHEFFDLCDQYGIMVWQDFAMACSFYPQNDEFARKVEEEVRSVVLKLRSHPSLAIWSGNNENDMNFVWHLAAFRQNPNRDRISRHTIPQVLFEFDPSRPYLPSSPYFSPKAYEMGSNQDDLPERHLWGPRGYYKAPFYTAEKARFVSEIGYHGCPNMESLQKMFTKDCVYPWTEGFKWNDEWMTKSVRAFPTEYWTNWRTERNDLMTNQIRLLFGSVSKKLEDFVTASQIVQAEAMKYFVERWRGGKFDKAGIIWWNVKDGWPIISDAVVDYYGGKKLAYHFIKNVQHNACVFINDAVDGFYPLVAVNDTRKPVNGKVTVTDVKSGKVYYQGDFFIDVNGKTIISHIPEIQGQGMLLIKYEVDGKSELNHYLYGQPPFDFSEYKKLLNKTGIYQSL